MDGIQPYAGAPRSSSLATLSINPTLTKAPADYFRAVRRRVWLVLAVGVPLTVGAAVFTLRQPAVYRASAQIFVEPPRYDEVLSALVSPDVGRQTPEPIDEYIPDRIARLKSKTLIEQVVNSPEIVQPASPGDDPAQELLDNLQARQLPKSKFVSVTLEGTDPSRTAKLLETLLKMFREQELDEKSKKNENSKTYAEESLKRMTHELASLDKSIQGKLRGSTTVGPGGQNILEEQWTSLGTSLLQKRARLDELKQQALFAEMIPGGREGGDFSSRAGDDRRAGTASALTQLSLKEYKAERCGDFENDSRRPPEGRLARLAPRRDPATESPDRHVGRMRPRPPSPLEAIGFVDGPKEIRTMEDQALPREGSLARFQESMPEHQKFLNDQDERKQLKQRIAALQTKLSEFDILSTSQKDPVVIPATVGEPTAPVRPKRALNIALGLILSFGLGIGLVCLLEYLDHSVKVPEHLSMGLTLPLFGVIPRIRRTALTHRGGHLWTPGAPESVEADAYRNLRASLVGSADKRGPIVTLLVTSAKAGEGKSTTALNLAATCARAGERTLLMDVDLRRPSLADVFKEDDHNVGLVDVLRGELPWQRTVVRTDTPLLDFLPTGDTREVPIEILGTLELRQLLVALSNHYDRVILDGPAVLGLADCRMLGRIVDAAVLVVRSGSHSLQPLLRAKAMLEQSHVVIAGVVFNGLYEDLKNWSSYGPYEPYGDAGSYGRAFGPAGGLESPAGEREHAALPA